MKRSSVLKSGMGEAVLNRGRMRGLYTGLYDEVESFRLIVPETRFKLRNITIMKPKTFAVKIRFGQ